MTATARGWTACGVPIALWIAHLTALASLSETLCGRDGLAWVPHALTAGLTVACVPFLVMSQRLVALPGGPGAGGEGDGSPDRGDDERDDLRFLGWLGLAMGAASVLLIVAEGLIVLGVDPCL